MLGSCKRTYPNGDTDGDNIDISLIKDGVEAQKLIEEVEEVIRQVKNGEIKGDYFEF